MGPPRCHVPSWLHTPLTEEQTGYKKLRFSIFSETPRASFSTQTHINHRVTSISLLALVDHDARPNCILKKELCRNQPRSIFPQKTPFQPHWTVSHPHPVYESSLRVGGGISRHAHRYLP